jgi:putative copper export protein
LRGDVSAVGSLKRSITAEMVLGGTVLLITAAFTTITGPPH